VVLVILDRFVWTIVDYALNVFAAFMLLRVLQVRDTDRQTDRQAGTDWRTE
jgi:hypothetical protein